MIKIIKGVYGHMVNGTVKPKTTEDEPFELTPEQETRLVSRGVAVYVGESEKDGTAEDISQAEVDSYLEDMSANELRELGRAIRWNKVFPKGANVNFYEITGEDLIFERTFERGVEDFTYACGTGTGSVVTVLTLQGKVSGHGVQVDMTGGRLVIDAERVHSHIASLYLTGPTNVVCKGEVTDEDLIIM